MANAIAPDAEQVGLSWLYKRSRTKNHEVISLYDFSNFPTTKNLVVFCLTTTGRIRKMKNTIKNITLAACCVATCAMSNVALATVGCMTVPGTSSSSAPASYSIEWSRGDEYSGIAVCTDENQGTNVDRLDIRLTQDHLAACYCKLLRPAVSKWYLASVAGSGGASSCVTNCAGNCRSTSPTNYQF